MAVPGWFPESSERTLRRLISDHDIRTVIEIGAFVGRSTLFFADLCERVITIDTFQAVSNSTRYYLEPIHREAANDQYMTFLRNTIKVSNIVGVVADSLTASTLDIRADMVYLDADHSYEAVTADIESWLPKADHLLAGDDYHWPGVRQAVSELDVETDGRTWWKILS